MPLKKSDKTFNEAISGDKDYLSINETFKKALTICERNEQMAEEILKGMELKIAKQEAEAQEAEKAKSGCFFWRKNKVAAAPQSANERALTLSSIK